MVTTTRHEHPLTVECWEQQPEGPGAPAVFWQVICRECGELYEGFRPVPFLRGADWLAHERRCISGAEAYGLDAVLEEGAEGLVLHIACPWCALHTEVRLDKEDEA